LLPLLAFLELARRRAAPVVTAGAGIVAVLSRETAVLAVLSVLFVELSKRRWRDAVLTGIVPLAVLGGWLLHLRALPGAADGWPKQLGVPFAWVAAKLARMGHAGDSALAAADALAALAVLVTVLVVLPMLMRGWRRWGVLQTTLVGHAVLALFLADDVMGDLFAYARVLVPLPVLALVTAFDEEHPPRQRFVLVLPAVLMAASGLLVLVADTVPLVDRWRTPRAKEQRVAIDGADLVLTGPWQVVTRPWRCEGECGISLAPGSPPTSLVVSAAGGNPVSLARTGSRIATVAPDVRVVIPLVPAGDLLTLSSIGGGVAQLNPLGRAPRRPLEMSGQVLVVPTVAQAQGADGSSWGSRIELVNRSSDRRRLTLWLLASNADNSEPARLEVELDGFERWVVDEAMRSLFGRRGTGAVVITGEVDGVEGRSRMTHRRRNAEFGQDVRVVRASGPQPDPARIGPILDAGREGVRVNVVCVSLAPMSQTARVSVRSGDRVSRTELALRSFEVWQVNKVVETLGGNVTEPIMVEVELDDVVSASSGWGVVPVVSVVDRDGPWTLLVP
jgi:hypothetical protein